MLPRAEDITEQHKAEYPKLIEHIGRYYETQEVPFGGLAPTPNGTDRTEANRMVVQKETNGRLSELFEDPNLDLVNDEAYEEDESRELYAVVASIFA